MNDKRRDGPSRSGGGKRPPPAGRPQRTRDNAAGASQKKGGGHKSRGGQGGSAAHRRGAGTDGGATGNRGEARSARPPRPATGRLSREQDRGERASDRRADRGGASGRAKENRPERTTARPAAPPGAASGKAKDNRPRRPAARPAPASQARTVDRGDDEARIAKVMARAGLCSRRDAEAWIAAGRVAVNGEILVGPARNVSPQDEITVDGRPLGAREATRLFLFHKPRGYVTTDRDPEGRPTIFSLLAKELPRLVTIGRLDINTEGLLLLTNDGGLARILELPATGWLRRYRVRARGEIDQAALDALRDGVTIEDVHYAGIEATLDRRQGANVWLTMGLREGKNREIKRVLEPLGLEVNRLIRLSFGPFQLGRLAEGAIEEVKTRVLRDQLGDELSREAGVDFEGPIKAPIVTQEVRRQRRAERLERESREGSRPARRDNAHGRRGADLAPDRETRPRPQRPKAGPRKHVSVLRDEKAEASAAGRQRIERAETADRKGRAVKVERVVKAGAAADQASARPRNARRFAKERAEAGNSRGGNAAARVQPGGGERTLRRKPRDPPGPREKR